MAKPFPLIFLTKEEETYYGKRYPFNKSDSKTEFLAKLYFFFYKNQFRMNQRPTFKTWNIESFWRKLKDIGVHKNFKNKTARAQN